MVFYYLYGIKKTSAMGYAKKKKLLDDAFICATLRTQIRIRQ
jgi:hypothetical protein